MSRFLIISIFLACLWSWDLTNAQVHGSVDVLTNVYECKLKRGCAGLVATKTKLLGILPILKDSGMQNWYEMKVKPVKVP